MVKCENWTKISLTQQLNVQREFCKDLQKLLRSIDQYHFCRLHGNLAVWKQSGGIKHLYRTVKCTIFSQFRVLCSTECLFLFHRWPRTLAGITSHQYCLQLRYPSLTMEGEMEQKKASRHCDRSGKWQEGDYSDCHYTNGITRVLHTFILVSAAVCSWIQLRIVTWEHAFSPYFPFAF